MIAIADPASPVPRPLVFGDPRLCTDGEILALGFAADGSLWSVEEPGLARHWNSATGQPLAWHFLSDLETVWCFGPAARLLASGSDDLTLWDVPLGQVLWAAAQPSWVTALAFTGDGALLATGHDDGAVRLWELRGRRLLGEYRGHKLAVSALAFHPTNGQLASAGEDRLIQLWEVPDGRALQTLTGTSDRITSLAWHPGEPRLASGGWDGAARFWDTAAGQPLLLLNTHAAPVNSVAFSPRGDLLASADAVGVIEVWQLPDCRRLHTIAGAGAEVHGLAFSPDGQRLAGAGQRRLALWDPGSGQALASGVAIQPAHAVLALGPDGRQLTTTDAEGKLRTWDAVYARPLDEPKSPPLKKVLMESAAYSPDGRWLAAGGADGLVYLWDLPSGQGPRLLEGPEGPITALAFAPGAGPLASAGNRSGEVWLWDPASGEPVLLIPDALDGCAVETLAFHPQGRLLAVGGIDFLATGGSDGAVCLWDLVDRCEVATFAGGTTSLAIHPTGRWLAAASLVRSLCVWDLEKRELLVEVTGPEEILTGLAYSPDGRWLAAGGEERLLRLWQITEGRPEENPRELQLDTQIQALCFSPDGRWLFTANGNRTCYRLEVQALAEGGRP